MKKLWQQGFFYALLFHGNPRDLSVMGMRLMEIK